MKQIVLAIPKSASSSLAKAISTATGTEMIQQNSVFDLPTGGRFSNAVGRRVLQSISTSLPRLKLPMLLRDRCPSHEYTCLSRYHGDICDFTSDEVKYVQWMAASCHSYKQHFPPTLSNKALFGDWTKVVLIRESEEVIEAYRRRAEKRSDARHEAPDWEVFLKSSSFCAALARELNKWKEGWTTEDDVLVVEYKELIEEPARTLRKILNTFGHDIELSDDYKLPKVRYSR